LTQVITDGKKLSGLSLVSNVFLTIVSGGLRLLKPVKTKRKYYNTRYNVNKPTKFLLTIVKGGLRLLKPVKSCLVIVV